jgi:hypothetical protein
VDDTLGEKGVVWTRLMVKSALLARRGKRMLIWYTSQMSIRAWLPCLEGLVVVFKHEIELVEDKVGKLSNLV